jgi:hypothetical protein
MTVTVSEQLLDKKLQPPHYKHIARIFASGNSYPVRIPRSIGECYGMDKPGYALVEGTDKGVSIKKIDEKKLL